MDVQEGQEQKKAKKVRLAIKYAVAQYFFFFPKKRRESCCLWKQGAGRSKMMRQVRRRHSIIKTRRSVWDVKKM
jgi:hypothetical protein